MTPDADRENIKAEDYGRKHGNMNLKLEACSGLCSFSIQTLLCMTLEDVSNPDLFVYIMISLHYDECETLIEQIKLSHLR